MKPKQASINYCISYCCSILYIPEDDSVSCNTLICLTSLVNGPFLAMMMQYPKHLFWHGMYIKP